MSATRTNGRGPAEVRAVALAYLLLTAPRELRAAWRADREFALAVLRRSRRPGYGGADAAWDLRHLAMALWDLEEALREPAEAQDWGVTDGMFVALGRGNGNSSDEAHPG